MAGKSATARAGYHHGNLEEALIAATIEVIEERGAEELSVREVAKRAGVSPGAPFRHFSSKKALLTAVAEQAIGRLTDAVQTSLEAVSDAQPLEQLRAIGRGYLNWAIANPTHFQIVSSRTLVDFDGSAKLVGENEAIRALMIDIITRAQASGQLRDEAKPHDLILASRAMVYGIARMWIDGHFREWHVDGRPEQAMNAALDLFIGSLKA